MSYMYPMDMSTSPESVRRRLDSIRMSRDVTLFSTSDYARGNRHGCPTIVLSTEIGVNATNFIAFDIPQDDQWLIVPAMALNHGNDDDEEEDGCSEYYPHGYDEDGNPIELDAAPEPQSSVALPTPASPSQSEAAASTHRAATRSTSAGGGSHHHHAHNRSASPDSADRLSWHHDDDDYDNRNDDSVTLLDDRAPPRSAASPTHGELRVIPPMPWPLSDHTSPQQEEGDPSSVSSLPRSSLLRDLAVHDYSNERGADDAYYYDVGVGAEGQQEQYPTYDDEKHEYYSSSSSSSSSRSGEDNTDNNNAEAWDRMLLDGGGSAAIGGGTAGQKGAPLMMDYNYVDEEINYGDDRYSQQPHEHDTSSQLLAVDVSPNPMSGFDPNNNNYNNSVNHADEEEEYDYAANDTYNEGGDSPAPRRNDVVNTDESTTGTPRWATLKGRAVMGDYYHDVSAAATTPDPELSLTRPTYRHTGMSMEPETPPPAQPRLLRQDGDAEADDVVDIPLPTTAMAATTTTTSAALRSSTVHLEEEPSAQRRSAASSHAPQMALNDYETQQPHQTEWEVVEKESEEQKYNNNNDADDDLAETEPHTKAMSMSPSPVRQQQTVLAPSASGAPSHSAPMSSQTTKKTSAPSPVPPRNSKKTAAAQHGCQCVVS
eukprot:PhM_4_TR2353/c0_g1_i1/m.54330